MSEAEKQRFIKLYLHYVFSRFKLSRNEVENAIKTIPDMLVDEFVSTADILRAEGKIEGKITGEIKTKFSTLLLFKKDFSNWNSEKLANYSILPIKKIEKFNNLLKEEKPFNTLLKNVKKLFFEKIELSKDDEQEIADLLKNYLKSQKK